MGFGTSTCYRDHMVSPVHHPALREAFDLVAEIRDTRLAAIRDAQSLGSDELVAQVRAVLRTSEALDPAGAFASFPAPVKHHLRDLQEALNRLQSLTETHSELYEQARTAHIVALRAAVTIHRDESRARSARRASAQTYERAGLGRRDLTRREIHRLSDWQAPSHEAIATPARASEPSLPGDDVLRLLSQIRVRDAARQLETGLILTEQMERIRAEALPSLRQGEPQLLIGETGGAKTALAEHLARLVRSRAPEFISGYGDITSAQVIGTHELRAADGATFTEFVPGPLLRAMSEGSPIILDELNAMPPEFLKRLNRILQLRPGDVMRVQEDAGNEVRIRDGFVIIATANEQLGRRYRGIEPLSAELLNRFGAGTFRVRYPDSGATFTDTPRENLLLATAAASLPDGRVPRHIRAEDLVRVARAAFVSQQVFTGRTSEGFRDFLSTEQAIDGNPGLSESVLSPRSLVSLVTKVARSGGAVTLDAAVQRFIEGVMHHQDRRVLTLILRGQGFPITDVE